MRRCTSRSICNKDDGESINETRGRNKEKEDNDSFSGEDVPDRNDNETIADRSSDNDESSSDEENSKADESVAPIVNDTPLSKLEWGKQLGVNANT